MLFRSAEIIREGLFRGADGGVLLTDRAFAGADTLATSYAISCAIKKLGDFDIILGGRQAIDGDTAQVGPQVAEKLGINQVTYAEEIIDVTDTDITIKRRLDKGVEVVKAKFPVLITVNGSADECRPRNAKLLQRFKHAKTKSEQSEINDDLITLFAARPDLTLNEWNTMDVEANHVDCGLSGSPTKVKKIENVVFQAKESKKLGASDAELEDLIIELITNHTIG